MQATGSAKVESNNNAWNQKPVLMRTSLFAAVFLAKAKTFGFIICLTMLDQVLQLNCTCRYNKNRFGNGAALTSIRKSPVLSPACHATPPSSTDSKYCRAGKAGVGVNSSMGVSATQKGRTEVGRIIEEAKRTTVTPARHNNAHKTWGENVRQRNSDRPVQFYRKTFKRYKHGCN